MRVSIETFSHWAIAQRKGRGLTQVQLAERMGVNQATVSSVERGETVTADYALKFARALQMPVLAVLAYAGLADDLGGDDLADVDLAEIRAALYRMDADKREMAIRWLNAIARDIAASDHLPPHRAGARAAKTS